MTNKEITRTKEKILSIFLSHLPSDEQGYLLETLSQHPEWGHFFVKSVAVKTQMLTARDWKGYQKILRTEQQFVENFLKKNV